MLLWMPAVTVCLCGCPSEEPSDPESGGDGDTSPVAIQLAFPKGTGLRERAAIAVSEWETTTQGLCTVTELDFADEDESLESLSAATDIVLVPMTLLPALVDAGWIAPLDGDESSEAMTRWKDVMDGLRDSACRPHGTPAVLPVSCPVLACYYRSDLLEAADKAPPETWEDYQMLLETLPEWAPDQTAVEPWNEEFRASMFLARAASSALHPDSLSLYLDIQNGESLIASEGFVRSLEASRDSLRHLDQQSLSLGPNDCLRELTAGRAALAIGHPADPAVNGDDLSADSESRFQGRIGVCSLPGTEQVFDRENNEWTDLSGASGPYRVTLAGFDGFAVCVHSGSLPVEQRAAWDLWGMIEDDFQAGGEPLQWLSGICRSGRLASARQTVWRGMPTNAWRAHLDVAAKQLTSTRVAADLPLPERRRFREVLTEQVTRAITGETSSDAALQAAAEDWNGLIEELGRERVLNTYRACLGLRPVSGP